jgi:hypothetical protein
LTLIGGARLSAGGRKGKRVGPAEPTGLEGCWAMRESLGCGERKRKKKEKAQVGLEKEKVRMERLRGDFQTFELFIRNHTSTKNHTTNINAIYTYSFI